jgi:hypothetical protein
MKNSPLAVIAAIDGQRVCVSFARQRFVHFPLRHCEIMSGDAVAAPQEGYFT